MAKKKSSKAPAMQYVGNGAFLPGIPRRDLSPVEVERLGRKMLEKTGLYKVIKPKENQDG